MKLETLIESVGGRMRIPERCGGADITRVFASNEMSALLEQAGPGTLLVTTLAGAQLGCLAELMDCPALCLADDTDPDPDLLETARLCGTAVVLSPLDMSETYDCLSRRLAGNDSRRS